MDLSHAVMVSTRGEVPEDDSFLRELIRETIADELGAAAWPEPMRSQIVDLQYSGRRLHSGPGGRSLIVLADGIPTGWVFLSPTDDHIRLVEIMLSPDWRRKGIGTAVVGEIVHQAQLEGKTVRLQVNATNTRAAQFYRRLGFETRSGDAVQNLMECPA